MKTYKITWEVNQYRPDEFSDLEDKWVDVVEANSKKEAEDLSFDNVSFEMGGGRIIKTSVLPN